MPWDKVDIKVIGVEVVRKPLNDEVEGEHYPDPYDDIVDLLQSKGYKVYLEYPHTSEKIAYEVFFIQKSLLLTIGEQGGCQGV